MKLLKLLFLLILSIPASAQIQLGADIDGEAADDYSSSVSLSSDGTTVAIGAQGNDGNGLASGHVRIYEYTSGSWSQLGSDIDGEAAGDNSGYSVSLSSDGTTVAIGAYANDGNGASAGHVRVYSTYNVGIEEVVKDIVVSPNPTSGLLKIVLTSSAEYEVFNINGQRVIRGVTEGQIDITNLPTGSYQLIITNEDGRSVHTIQKI